LARDSLLNSQPPTGGEEVVMLPKRPSTQVPAANGPPPAPNLNYLLAALPSEDYERVVHTLELIPLELKKVVHKPGDRIQYVYFPGGGFFSMLTVLEDGGMVEVATVGREGMIGVSAVLDDNRATALSMVQGETDICFRMPADAFRREMDRRGAFYELLTRFGQALVGFIMQSTACNAMHSVEQRLARWLLMAQDRMGRDDFPLTQEFVAMMLGASRPTVTVVAGTLQKAGLITYHRGHVTIVDREKLESASCECYRTATELLRAVADPSAGSQAPLNARRNPNTR
jgi:CRP-like cAMP-binding protein